MKSTCESKVFLLLEGDDIVLEILSTTSFCNGYGYAETALCFFFLFSDMVFGVCLIGVGGGF